MAQFTPKYSIESKIKTATITNGCIYIATDTQRVFVDLDNTRVCLSDIIYLDTDKERTDLLAPINNKIYLVLETNKIWLFRNSEWVSLGSNNVNVDGLTIKENSTTNSLQVEGIVEKNSQQIKYDWVGTKAQWEAGRAALTIPDSYVCYITDDSEAVIASEVATQEQALEGVNDQTIMTPLKVKSVIDNRLSGLKLVSITKTEFDALTTKDPNTLYLVTETA